MHFLAQLIRTLVPAIAVLSIVTPSFTAPSPVWAGTHCVQFDVAQIAAADDITTDEFRTMNASEKLIRIRLPISSLVRLGSEDSLLQYLYVLSGPTDTPFQIVDYAPKTTLHSNLASNVEIEASHGKTASLGLKAVAPKEFAVPTDASVSLSSNSHESQRFETLPPLRLVAASGTMHRGVSAYFKLKPSTQTTLEGDKIFEITARVPVTWRAGLIYVNCAAFGRATGFAKSAEQSNFVCGTRQFAVGVHIDGDDDAKETVWKLSETQRQLRRLAQRHASEIADHRFPSVGHKIGAALSLIKPRIPDRWLEQLMQSDDYHAFERHLPRKLQQAATDYREARREVVNYAG